jgi:predicted O-methyltransferase YrrM
MQEHPMPEDVFIAAARKCKSFLQNTTAGLLTAHKQQAPGFPWRTFHDTWTDALARNAQPSLLHIASTQWQASLLAAEVCKAARVADACSFRGPCRVTVVALGNATLDTQHLQNMTVLQAVPAAATKPYAVVAVHLPARTFQETLHVVRLAYPLVRSGGQMILEGDVSPTAYEAAVAHAVQSGGGTLPVLQPAQPSGQWLYKPFTKSASHALVQQTLFHASYKAMELSRDGAMTFVGMGHSFECPMQAAFMHNAAAYRGVRHVCEVGFNAGHSAINALATNPNITLVAFDLGALPWSQGMSDFVHQMFPGRFKYIKGSSFDTLPQYARQVRSGSAVACDLFFIDGDHSYDGASKDFANALQATAPNAYLVADDYTQSFPGVVRAWDEMVQGGLIEEVLCQQTQDKYRGYQKGWCVGRARATAARAVPKPTTTTIHVALAQCGGAPDQLMELEVLVKSMLTYADPLDAIHLHLVLTEGTAAALVLRLQSLAARVRPAFAVSVYPPHKDIMDMFKPCSTQKLSMHEVLPSDVACAVVLDRDVLVVRSLHGFSNLACNLGDRLLAMAPEGGIFYSKLQGPHLANVTYLPPTGFNGGILGMNVAALRMVDFTSVMRRAHRRYSALNYSLVLGDQDMLNAFFVEHPALLQPMDCAFNTRVDDSGASYDCCTTGGGFHDSVIVHGNRGVFQKCGPLGAFWRQHAAVFARYRGFILPSAPVHLHC